VLGNGGTSGSLTGNVLDNSVFGVDLSSFLDYQGVISGTGLFVQAGTGTTDLTGTNTNSGGSEITAGTLELGPGGSVNSGVLFGPGAQATLRLDTGPSQIGGFIAGATTGDAIDLRYQAFASGDVAVWNQATANTGTLSVATSGGATLTSLNLVGQYVSSDFAAVSDGGGGTQIDVVSAATQLVQAMASISTNGSSTSGSGATSGADHSTQHHLAPGH
jgi:fibronectin-binding autotransporter adhesin